MNLEQEPTIEQLQELLRNVHEDREGDDGRRFIVWVDHEANVHVDELEELSRRFPEEFTNATVPATFNIESVLTASRHPVIRFRLESVLGGEEGYVGPEAAADDGWLSELFDSLIQAWRDGDTGVLDG